MLAKRAFYHLSHSASPGKLILKCILFFLHLQNNFNWDMVQCI
jgi:hypothetical protein